MGPPPLEETKIDEFTHAACSPGWFDVLNGEILLPTPTPHPRQKHDAVSGVRVGKRSPQELSPTHSRGKLLRPPPEMRTGYFGVVWWLLFSCGEL